jgi:hypothetical protein
MAIKKKYLITYSFLDELDEEKRTAIVAIGTYDDSVSEAEDNTIFFYFEDEVEFFGAVKNDADEFRIFNYEKA